MEGKKIEKVLELGDGVVLMKMDDGTYASAKVIDPEIPADVIEEFFEPEAKEEKTGKKVKEEVKEKEKEKEKEKTKEDPDDELTWDDLKDMKRKALVKLISERKLMVDEDDFEDDDEGLRKEIADELDIEVPKKDKKGSEDEAPTKEKEDEDDYTWGDLVKMDWDELVDLIKENKLDTDPDDFDEDTQEDKLRRAIAKECGIEAPLKKK